MTTVELDPVFVKALKFLHSKAKDSGAQLKQLLDDAIAQRKGLKVPSHSGDGGKSSPARSKSDDDSKKKEAEKRSSDKTNKDNSEPDVKKIKLDSKSRSKDERDAREKEKEKDRAKREKDKREKEERDAQKLKDRAEKERKEKELAISKAEAEAAMVISDEEEPASQINAGDFAIEMGIACQVCRQFDVSSGNQLVECQECHSLYHQECHKPPVTEEDVSDPRFVWYCFRCTRSLKKMMTQKAAKPKPAAPPTSVGKEPPPTSSKPTKTDTSSKSVGQAFRRIDPKTIVPSADAPNLTSTTSKPMVGLAGLAANLHKPKGESKSGTGSRNKGDLKGEGTKSSSKLEIKSSGNKSDSSSKSSNGGSKSDSSSKPSSSTKSEDRKHDGWSSTSREEKDKEKKLDSGSKLSSKVDEKKSIDSKSTSSSSSSSSLKEEKKSEKKPELGKSSLNLEPSKLDVTSPKSSSQASTPTTPDSPSPSKVNSSTSNKQAVANLSLVTANKRIQMMKKKAQTKPGTEKKLHIK